MQKINFEEVKSKILGFVKEKGPVLPSDVAEHLGIPLLYASAILSQLASENEVRISNMKIGGSPLYLLRGQEKMLQRFFSALPEKEREVVEALKRKGIVEDEKELAAYRVALRNLKDFAIPFRANIGNEQKLFWRWYLLSKEETAKIVASTTKPIAKVEARVKIAREKKKEEFAEILRSYLEKNSIKILEEKIVRKNREAELVLQVSSNIGKLKFFCIAKNKKITVADAMLAYQKGQEKKLPLMLLGNGIARNAAKKAEELGIIVKNLEQKI